MKTPLRYQISEYDCGPTAMLDAMSYLFARELIPPEVIRNIMLYSLDCYNTEGVSGKSGTSCAAMMFLSNWLNNFGKLGRLPISSQYLTGAGVYLGSSSLVNDALHRGGAAVVRLFFDEWHYVLLTGERDGIVRMFDPYYVAAPQLPEGIEMVADALESCNRLVHERFFNQEKLAIYALGPTETREAILLFNDATKLTEERTVEYFI